MDEWRSNDRVNVRSDRSIDYLEIFYSWVQFIHCICCTEFLRTGLVIAEIWYFDSWFYLVSFVQDWDARPACGVDPRHSERSGRQRAACHRRLQVGGHAEEAVEARRRNVRKKRLLCSVVLCWCLVMLYVVALQVAGSSPVIFSVWSTARLSCSGST